ncbi:MAG: MGH1-like glycoside hydrolase domain-containing protein, partial [Planctomycetota bacterium]
VKELLPDLVANYREWEQSHLGPEGLFWQIDDRDGMEMSVGGNGCKPGYRPTINSYMYADAEAIASIAELVGQADLADEFRVKAAEIKRLVQERLWDDDARFFKVLPVEPGSQLVDVREQIGYTPWYVNLPDPGFEDAWKQLMDPDGFYAPHGPTTCERRHPGFKLDYEGHECQWNGPSWPYSTSVTLTAMANLLNHYQQDFVDKRDYFDILGIYAGAQHLTREDGTVVPWIDENLNPLTGDWIARTVLKSRANTIPERGKDYNHSTFCDLVISGLVGLRPRPDDTVEVNPLVPDDTWDWFCLDGLPYHGHTLTVLYDRTGERYGRGKGLRILADGRQIAESPTLGRLTGKLPPLHSLTEEEKDIMAGHPPADPQVRQPSGAETSGGWAKHPGNPVLGGDMGTCFDVSVLKEADTFRMWFSWRPKDSIALVESRDGINWSEPTIVLGPAPTGWEDGVNRPVVVKRSDGYHMWYTGQVWHSDRHGRSCLGCATSPDGREWSRVSAKPVLSPDLPWENEAVMNPSVIWDEAANQFRMWYCGGEQWEPNAVGHATSPDGLVWTRLQDTPVFQSDPSIAWEHDRVAGCQVVRQGNWHLLFYIGYRDIDHAQIGLARSRDGISGWERHPGNPIIRPGRDKWDHDACYKPYALLDSGRWLLWYNGRHADLEQIGLAIHEGVDLGFGD